MSDIRSVSYGQNKIQYSLVYRRRTTLEIAVEPDMSIKVVAPIGTPPSDIDKKVHKRAGWILRQQKYFRQFEPRRTVRRYVSGETHLYLGRQYRLRVERHTQAGVKLKRGFIHVQSHAPGKPEVTRGLVDAWYRERAHIKFRERLEESLKRFPAPENARPIALVVRALKQRWGSMTPSRRLMLNLRLIESPVDAIDYVITHELCHVQYPHHGAAFFSLLDRVMPDWKRRKERLERLLS